MDITKVREISKRASARIKELEAKVKSLTAGADRQTKYAALVKGRKIGEVVAEVVEDVKEKLTEMQVPAEAVEQAAEIVETAVAEAVEEAPAEGGEAAAVETDLIDQETKDELAQVAASDEIEDEEIKSAAAKLLKTCNSKKAFGREIMKVIKKMSYASDFSGRVVTRHNAEGNLGGNRSKAIDDLKKFARESGK